jgi:hypothetical protein
VLVLAACASIGAFAIHQWTVDRANRDLAAARAEAGEDRRVRVPKAELAAVRRSAAEQAEGLEHELAEARAQLAASQAATADAERRLAAAVTPPVAGAPGASTPLAAGGPVKPDLARGNFSVRDDFRVYSPDARLKVGDNITISSPVGIMLSDDDLSTIAGDLAVETPTGKVEAMHAFVDIVDGKIEMTADAMRFTNK